MQKINSFYKLIGVLCALLTVLNMSAQSGVRNTFYMQLSAEAYPRQAGYVYVSMGDNDLLTHSATPGNRDLDSSFCTSYRAEAMDGSIGSLLADGSYTAYLFARSRDGYAFTGWQPLAFPAGTLSLATRVDDYVMQRNYYKQELTLDTLLMTRGYDMDTYLQQVMIAHPEWLDAMGNILPQYEDSTIQAFFHTAPFTSFGPWQAQFAPTEVLFAADTAFMVVDPLHALPVRARFGVRYSEKISDFSSQLQGDGLTYQFAEQFTSASAPTADQYLFELLYTPRNIHGVHTCHALLLADKATGNATSQADATITITEDYTPAFTLSQSHYDFGSADLGQADTLVIQIQAPNAVARLSAAQGLHWTATLSGATSMVADISDQGQCVVIYPRQHGGNDQTTLTITAAYTDAAGVTLTASQSCVLTGSATSVLSPNTLSWAIDRLLIDDRNIQPFVGQNSQQPITITCTSADWQQLITIEGNGTSSPMLSAAGHYLEGQVHLVATQSAGDLVESTRIETTLLVTRHTPMAVWHWQKLYWGTTATDPVATTSDGDWTLTMMSDSHNAITYDDLHHEAQVAQGTGLATASFRFQQAESDTYTALDTLFHTTISIDPGLLPLNITDQAMFDALTLQQGNAVSFDQGMVRFAYVSTDDYRSARSWTMAFHGYPDSLFFSVSGENTWSVQESADGTHWHTTFADEILPAGLFAWPLDMNTRYVRIAYGAQLIDSDGILRNVQITAHPRARVHINKESVSQSDKLWLPQLADGTAHQSLLLDILSDHALRLTTSSPAFSVSPAVLPADTGLVTLQVTAVGDAATEAQLQVVDGVTAQPLLTLPMQVFAFPAALPVVLDQDDPDRYYHVHTTSQFAQWQADTRTILLCNSEANTPRSLSLAFADMPYSLTFTHDGIRSADRWLIEESADGQNWSVARSAAAEITGQMTCMLRPVTRFVRIVYRSSFTESVHITGLQIVGQERVEMDADSLFFDADILMRTVQLTAIDVPGLTLSINSSHFTITDGYLPASQTLTMTEQQYSDCLGHNHTGTLPIIVTWDGEQAFEQAELTVYSTSDNSILATLPLQAQWHAITASSATLSGLYTGVVNGLQLEGTFQGTQYHQVDLSAAFDAAGLTLFDQIYVFGPTSTIDRTTVITTPTVALGSNALTPCYVLTRATDREYRFLRLIDNVNAAPRVHAAPLGDDSSRSVFITGFCPYASTGYTKGEEGIFCFQSSAGATIDVCLSDAYLYARNKSIDGSRNITTSFSESYVRGSGAVLVFECTATANVSNPMQAVIHLRGNNVLSSTTGCYYSFSGGKVTQVSAPVQVHTSGRNSYTHLTFDDRWPGSTGHTYGQLTLHKPALNAPTIDMGNANTVVNFRGGHILMENAQSLSNNYHSSQAIAWRNGKMSGIMLASGLGDDGVGGSVCFYDGTTSAFAMEVQEKNRAYYQMDSSDSTLTHCLRLPEATFVYGGSHCPLRACSSAASRGGAPSDGVSLLGEYVCLLPADGQVDLTTIMHDQNPDSSLADYYTSHDMAPYAAQSVVPDADGYIHLWIPEGYGHVEVLRDLQLAYWKACMTSIEAEQNGYGGSMGGDVTFEENTVVDNFLYCVIDDNMHDVISSPSYSAPLLNPSTGEYITIHPTRIGERNQYYVTNAEPYTVQSKLYYITTIPSADQWMTFTAPFDVSRMWVMETYSEQALEQMHSLLAVDRESIAVEQAAHNADFAAFYGVTMVMGQNKSFDAIYDEYIRWAKQQDHELGFYSGTGEYTTRGRHLLTPYAHSADTAADFLLYESNALWYNLPGDSLMQTGWQLTAPVPDGHQPLMTHDHTYAMLFPYCPGCDIIDTTESGWVDYMPREYWDYWTGKLLIMEGEGPQTLHGSSYLTSVAGLQTPRKTAKHMGNSTFAVLSQNPVDESVSIYPYDPVIYNEGYWYNGELDAEMGNVIQPTQSFLAGHLPYTNGVDLMSGRITHSDDYVPDTIPPVLPPDTIVTPPDTIIVPSDTIVVPSDTIIVPSDTIIVPSDTIIVPSDTIIVPSDTIVTPPDTIVTPPDTLGSALQYVLQSGRFRIYNLLGQPVLPDAVTQAEFYRLPPGIYIASDDRRSFVFSVGRR